MKIILGAAFFLGLIWSLNLDFIQWKNYKHWKEVYRQEVEQALPEITYSTSVGVAYSGGVVSSHIDFASSSILNSSVGAECFCK